MECGVTDVIFLFPPAHGNLGVFKTHLGVAYLRAALARDGIKTAQYLNPSPGTVDEIAQEVLAPKPRVAGFTVYDANFPLSLALAHSLKEKQPELKVVFGGPSASFCALEILERHPVVDACVLGEAEETGARIFAKLLDGDSFENGPPGVAVRRNGAALLTGVPALVGTSLPSLPAQSALDSTPSPYLSGILTDGRAGILTGRGCTHHCQYCCFAALGRKKLRLHSVERVVAELEYIAEHQKRTGEQYAVAIHDDAFTLLPSRAKALCQAIADRNLGLVLSCITRADTLDEELLRLMREAGFASVAFGLESAVPKVLRATGKVRPPDWPDPSLEPEEEFVERVRTSVVAAKKHGFNVGVSIILGLPGENAEDADVTLRFVKSLPIDYYMHNFLWVFPGTPLWETHQRWNIGCATNAMGLATTTEYAYDLTRLRPRPKCSLEQDATVVRRSAADALYGCAAGVAPERGIGVAVVHAGELPSPTAAWLREVLAVGSIVVQVYPRLKRSDEPLRLHEDRCMFSECLVPARHHIQLLPREGQPGEERWMAACAGVDLYCTHKPKLLTLRFSDSPAPLLDWLKDIPTRCSACEVTDYLRRPEELARFLDGSNGNELGASLRRKPVPPGLKYPGRWVAGTAPCRSLTRLEIDAAGRVRCCRQGEPIGAVGDSREALAGRLARAAEEAERRRGCDQCPNSHCPRCPFPGLEDAAYCRIMGEQARVLGLLIWTHLYSRVPSMLALQRDLLGGD